MPLPEMVIAYNNMLRSGFARFKYPAQRLAWFMGLGEPTKLGELNSLHYDRLCRLRGRIANSKSSIIGCDITSGYRGGLVVSKEWPPPKRRVPRAQQFTETERFIRRSKMQGHDKLVLAIAQRYHTHFHRLSPTKSYEPIIYMGEHIKSDTQARVYFNYATNRIVVIGRIPINIGPMPNLDLVRVPTAVKQRGGYKRPLYVAKVEGHEWTWAAYDKDSNIIGYIAGSTEDKVYLHCWNRTLQHTPEKAVADWVNAQIVGGK